jgi:hypothetical protein
MSTFLRFHFIVLFAAFGAVLCAADHAEIETEMKRIELLEKALEEGGVSEVLAGALLAPVIHSPYYAERLARLEPERQAVEQAKREFGFKLAVELDKTAMRLQKRTDSVERVRQAALLLDLAAWLRTAQRQSVRGQTFTFDILLDKRERLWLGKKHDFNTGRGRDGAKLWW